MGVLLLVSVSGIVTVEFAGFVHHGHYYEGAFSCFSRSGNQGFVMAVEKPVVYVDCSSRDEIF